MCSWGGFDVVIPTNTKNTSQAKAFMKEISTDGNVNTLADLVPKSIPAFYALAPTYIRLLLEPIMTYTRQWPADFAFHDLGKRMSGMSLFSDRVYALTCTYRLSQRDRRDDPRGGEARA